MREKGGQTIVQEGNLISGRAGVHFLTEKSARGEDAWVGDHFRTSYLSTSGQQGLRADVSNHKHL